MKTKMILTPMVMALMAGSMAHADDKRGSRNHTPPGIESSQWEAMSDADKKAFHQERKAKWKKMNDAEKVKVIEDHRAKRMEKMDEKWSAMSDAEKVKFTEEKMKKNKGKHRKSKSE